MKIQLLAGIGGFPIGTIHRVIDVIPHGGHTDEPCQYLIQGQVYVLPSQCRLIDGEQMMPLTMDLQKRNNALKAMLDHVSEQSADDARQYGELKRDRDRLAAENVDLKNQIADLKHDATMHGWLK
jgi:hypothetical protein